MREPTPFSLLRSNMLLRSKVGADFGSLLCHVDQGWQTAYHVTSARLVHLPEERLAGQPGVALLRVAGVPRARQRHLRVKARLPCRKRGGVDRRAVRSHLGQAPLLSLLRCLLGRQRVQLHLADARGCRLRRSLSGVSGKWAYAAAKHCTAPFPAASPVPPRPSRKSSPVHWRRVKKPGTPCVRKEQAGRWRCPQACASRPKQRALASRKQARTMPMLASTCSSSLAARSSSSPSLSPRTLQAREQRDAS